MLVTAGDPRQVGQLGNAVHQLGDFFAKFIADVGQCDGGVFDRIVQQARRDNDGRHPHFGQNGRHRDTMGDIRLAGDAFLAFMSFFGKGVGALNDLTINKRVVFRQNDLQTLNIHA